MDFRKQISHDKNIVDKELELFFDYQLKTIDSDKFLRSLYNSIKGYVLNGGKRLRPIALIKAYKAVNGNDNNTTTNNIIKACLCVELMHNSTLVHDDIMDEDDFRRNKPSIHKQIKDFYLNDNNEIISTGSLFDRSSSRFAVTHAICAGNILYSMGQLALSKSSFDPDLVKRALNVYSDSYKIINNGQVMDNYLELKGTVTEKQYYDMIISKTGKLFEASVLIGAILGGAERKQLDALSNYAINAATTFQLQDDIMDINPKMKKGHALGSDIRQGKRTLIIIKALEKADNNQKKVILSILGNVAASDEDIDSVISILYKTGAVDYVKQLALKKIRKGKEYLQKADFSSESLDFFHGFADFMINRDV